MLEIDRQRIIRFLATTAPGFLLAAMLTAVCFRLHLSFATTGFLYLVVVVLQSLIGNFASSALVSCVTVLCLDYFFVPPILTLQVTSPLDGVALFSFLITGLVITRLTTQVRKDATIKDSQHRQMNRLYDLASLLLSLDPNEALLSKTVELIRQAFHINAICLYNSRSGHVYSAGNSQRRLTEKTLASHRAQQGSDNEDGLVFRCLSTAEGTLGAIGFDGLPEPGLNAVPLCALAAVMLERDHAFQNASHSAAAAQVEVFRSAVLDALAHEFKTPLATILTAAGCLRETRADSPILGELSGLIESEAARLSTLTSRVLKTSKLDGDQVKPRLEPMDVSELVTLLVDQYLPQSANREIRVIREQRPTHVLADKELLQLAVRQLLENACKYSTQGMPVDVSIEANKDHAAVRVRSLGRLIEDRERTRIFERFYRGVSSNAVAGSGLGLYFVRKIVCAHGGSVDLEQENDGGGPKTVFRLTLPLFKSA